MSVTWFFNSSTNFPQNVQKIHEHEGFHNYLAIFKVVPENTGYYKCNGKDTVSNAYFTAKGLLEIVRYVKCFHNFASII